MKIFINSVLKALFLLNPRRRRSSHGSLPQSLEPRLVLSTTFSTLYQDTNGSGDTLPAMNDQGDAIYLDPKSIRPRFGTQPLEPARWMTNGNTVLPGLTKGYWNASLHASIGLPLRPLINHNYLMPPQINNAGKAVLTQYLDRNLSQQELIVYDVTKRNRVATVTTLGKFKLIKEVQINESGKVVVIAEEDDGNGGIYELNGTTLQSVFVRKGLAASIDSLVLQDDGSVIFRAMDSLFTLKPGGVPSPLMGENESDVYIWKGVGQISNSENRIDSVQPYLSFTVSCSTYMRAGDRPFSVRFKTRDLEGSLGTATAGVDYEPVDTVITFSPGTSSILVRVPIINDDIWEGGAEVLAVDVSPVTDPWSSPLVYMPSGAEGLTELGIIHDYLSSTHLSIETIAEPDRVDSKFTYKLRPPNTPVAKDTPFEFAVIPLTATADDVEQRTGSGVFAKGSREELSYSFNILDDESSPLLKENRKTFVVVFKSPDKAARLGTTVLRVTITDADYVSPSPPSTNNDSYDRNSGLRGHLGINREGDVAYLVKAKDRIIVVSDNEIKRVIPTHNYSQVYSPIVLSNNRSVVFRANIGSVYGLYRGQTPAKDKVVSTGQSLSARNVLKTIDGGAFQFGASDNGTVFFRGISTVYSSSDPGSGGAKPGIFSTRIDKVEPIILDIAVTDAVTNLAASLGNSNFRKIPIKYVVKGTDIPIEIRFAVYQSSDMTWDASDTRLDADVMTAAGKVPSVKRKQGTYTGDSLYLKSNVSLKYGQRFLIVKVDPDNAIRESDEDNNTMFVIPLIPENQPAAFLASGLFAIYSNTANEDTVAHAISGRISRDTADFTNALQDISTTWSNAGGTFKDEEPLPYRGDDRRLNKGLAGPLSTLIAIIKETDKQTRFTMSGLKITEAFDSQMEHRIASLHYEGRSIDFSATGDRAKRLAGLTLLAGFHWNVNEKPSTGSQHVHLSHRGSKAKLSISGLVQALTWGNDQNLISDARFMDLKSRLNKALAAAKDPNLSASVRSTGVKSWLHSFIGAIPDSAPSGFVTTMVSSISGLPAQKTHLHLLLKRNAAIVRDNAALWN